MAPDAAKAAPAAAPASPEALLPGNDPAYEWRIVTLLTIGFGLVGLDRWVISALFPAMARDLNLNYQELGVLVGSLGIAWGLFSIIGGGLGDRFGRRRVLVPAIVGFSLLSGVSGLAAGLTSLLAIRIIMGVNEGAFCPVSFAAVSEASRPTRRGMNLGITQSAFPLFGLALGPLIATQLLQFTSWRWAFVLVGVPGLIVAAFLARIVREPPSVGAHGHEHRAPAGELFRHRNVPLGMLALLCAMSGIFSLGAMVPSYLVDYLKLTTAQMGFVTSAIGFGGFLGQLALPALSDVIGRKPVALGGFVFATGLVYAFAQATTVPALFALLFVACFFCFGLLGLLTGAIAAEAAPRGLVSSTTGIIVASGEIFGGGIAPVIAGAVAQHFGIQHTLTMALIGLAVGIIVCLFLRETAPRLLARRSGQP
ncbi:MAG TPA: MFS transporter [Steroidobacteraceae bacterium]|nr:MFS transporter [Steroidobacteraceae bacterium]